MIRSLRRRLRDKSKEYEDVSSELSSCRYDHIRSRAIIKWALSNAQEDFHGLNMTENEAGVVEIILRLMRDVEAGRVKLRPAYFLERPK